MCARGVGKWRAGAGGGPREDTVDSRSGGRRQLEDRQKKGKGNHGGLRDRRGRVARGLAMEPECAGPGSAQTQNPGSARTTQARAAPAEEEREYFKPSAD